MKEKSKIVSKKESAVSKTIPKNKLDSKSKTNSKTEIKSKNNLDRQKEKTKTKNSKLLKRLTIVSIIVVLILGSLYGYSLWQNNIFYTISFSEIEGLNLLYDSLSVRNGSDFSFEVELKQGFACYDELFQITANGINLEEVEKEFIIKNVKSNIEISVEGVGTENLQITNKELTGSNSASERLVIPYGVVAIANNACKSNSTITEVVIPDSVKIIGDNAFSSCVNLSEIAMGKNVERIGKSVFEQTAWLSSKPDGFVYLENWVYSFKNYSTSEAFIIKEGIVGIASSAFPPSLNIVSIELPNSLKYICNNVFMEKKLTELNLPDGIEFIGYQAFAATNIQELTLPSTLIEIDNEAFIMCKFLKNVTLESETILGKVAFAACENLEKVYFTKGINNIPEGLFAFCVKLNSVTINSEKVPTLNKSSAFEGINDLHIYVIPSKVNTFKASAGWSLFSDNIFAIPEE